MAAKHRLAFRAGKSLTAPLDRVKLLLQTRGGLGKTAVAQAARRGGVLDALVAIGREEGLRGYWKGNLPQARDGSLARDEAATALLPSVCAGALLVKDEPAWRVSRPI